MNWFAITHKKTGHALVNLFGELGVGQPVEDFIAELRDVESIGLRVDSPGGDSHTGLKVHAAFQLRHVEATITGRCGSAALIATLAAKKISCIDSARLLIHQPAVFAFGNARCLREAADNLDPLAERFELILACRTNQPIAAVRAWLAKDTYLSAQEALEAGLVDKIFTPPAPHGETVTAGSEILPATIATEQEEMFSAWLNCFGKIETANREKFLQNLHLWALENVR